MTLKNAVYQDAAISLDEHASDQVQHICATLERPCLGSANAADQMRISNAVAVSGHLL